MTTSMDTTKAEIARFLSGSDPGVLCITGGWGVGKTFLWRDGIDALRKSQEAKLARYSYVSLFGLNSLDDVKASLFENMEWLDQEATNFAQRGKAAARSLAARAKKLSELAGALPWVGQALTRARPLYFSLIQNQIVCIDDLDRRSKNLDVKDVLGLVSFLREQRGCKVALLLNAEQLDDKKEEFESLLEKVIETKVVLAPTAAESAAIALPTQDAISAALRDYCQTLGIRNIRIIRQIERLVRRVDELLHEFPDPIRKQAIHSLALFGWSKFDRENAPKMEFLTISSIERALARRDGTTTTKEEEVWEGMLAKYEFRRSDDFDLALLKYVDSMILDTENIITEARALQERQRIGELHGTFEGAWRSFHDSFADDEDRVIRQIVEGTKNSYEVVSLSNLNETILTLKALRKDAEAKDVLTFFADKVKDIAYWDAQYDAFRPQSFDPDVSAIIEQKKLVKPAEFDVAEALLRAGKDYDKETIARLATVPVETYHDLISAARGKDLRALVLSALDFRRISNASDDMLRVVALMEEALRMVGRRSRLNAIRIKKYGVSIDKPGPIDNPANR
jgi:hypothetical protein